MVWLNKRYGRRKGRKSWNPSEIDQEWEEKKLGLLFLGLIIVFILLGLFMWWMKNNIR